MPGRQTTSDRASRPRRVWLLVAALLLASSADAVSGGGFGGPGSPVPVPASPPLSIQPSSAPGDTLDLGLLPDAGLFLLSLVGTGLVLWWGLDTWRSWQQAPRAVLVGLLLTEGEDLKLALADLARRHDPDAPDTGRRALQSAARLLLARPDTWASGTLRITRSRDQAGADRDVRRWAVQARAAFDVQTTGQYPDGDLHRGFRSAADPHHARGGTYLAVTLAVSTHGVALRAGSTNRDGIREVLQRLTGAVPAQVGQIEVVWSPDRAGELLTGDQAIARYPASVPL